MYRTAIGADLLVLQSQPAAIAYGIYLPLILYNYGLEQEQGKLHSENPSNQHGSEGRRIGRRNARQRESEREARLYSAPSARARITARPGQPRELGPFQSV